MRPILTVFNKWNTFLTRKCTQESRDIFSRFWSSSESYKFYYKNVFLILHDIQDLLFTNGAFTHQEFVSITTWKVDCEDDFFLSLTLAQITSRLQIFYLHKLWNYLNILIHLVIYNLLIIQGFSFNISFYIHGFLIIGVIRCHGCLLHANLEYNIPSFGIWFHLKIGLLFLFFDL